MAKNKDTKPKRVSVSFSVRDWLDIELALRRDITQMEASAKGWEKLATEMNADGQPAFPNAPGNAQYVRERIEKSRRFIKEIDHKLITRR